MVDGPATFWGRGLALGPQIPPPESLSMCKVIRSKRQSPVRTPVSASVGIGLSSIGLCASLPRASTHGLTIEWVQFARRLRSLDQVVVPRLPRPYDRSRRVSPIGRHRALQNHLTRRKISAVRGLFAA
jgi:hypothetical protein